MKYRKATRDERAQHARSGGLYPLHAIVTDSAGRAIKIEDLRGAWCAPDPVWEVLAPHGFIFDEMGSHSILEWTLKDARAATHIYTLVPCDCCADPD